MLTTRTFFFWFIQITRNHADNLTKEKIMTPHFSLQVFH
jgi:hypothetical protein